jgi:hypothetical protein
MTRDASDTCVNKKIHGSPLTVSLKSHLLLVRVDEKTMTWFKLTDGREQVYSEAYFLKLTV